MKSELLHVVTAISNPIRWQSRIVLYKQFEQHMLDSGVNLTVVECAYGDRPFVLNTNPSVNHIAVRAKTLLWEKECLLNIGFARLPMDWKYAAWIDADVEFRKSGWAAETVHALQQYDVVQPWTHCYDLGPNDDHLQAHRSFASLVQAGAPIAQLVAASSYGGYGEGGAEFAHPGYAWAATRRTLNQLGGLIDTAILGSADHHMALAMKGRVDASVPGKMSASYMRHLLAWQKRAVQHVALNIGALPGTIEHGWHGPKQGRNYIGRWDVLLKNGFDPDTDIVRNTWGVWELAGNKPQLRSDIDIYFRNRDEDLNGLG